jgi:hypothetical protein
VVKRNPGYAENIGSQGPTPGELVLNSFRGLEAAPGLDGSPIDVDLAPFFGCRGTLRALVAAAKHRITDQVRASRVFDLDQGNSRAACAWRIAELAATFEVGSPPAFPTRRSSELALFPGSRFSWQPILDPS